MKAFAASAGTRTFAWKGSLKDIAAIGRITVAMVFLANAAGATPPGTTKFGKSALKGNTGANNTAVGFQAMDPNALCTGVGTPNACCTDVGKGACGNSGADNTAVGMSALQANTNGSANTAVGFSALQANTTRGDNTAVGVEELFAKTGSGNTAVGKRALQANTTANGNTALSDTRYQNLPARRGS